MRDRFELDDPRAQRLVAVLLEILHPPDVDQRRGQEAAHAEVEDQTALDDLDHEALDRLAALGSLLDLAPCLLEARALLGEDETPVGVLLLHDERIDLVTERDLLEGVDVPADRELGDRDDAFALVADVDEDLIAVDAYDRARDDIPLAELLERRGVIGDELAIDLEPDSWLCGDDLGVGLGHRLVDSSRASKDADVGRGVP